MVLNDHLHDCCFNEKCHESVREVPGEGQAEGSSNCAAGSNGCCKRCSSSSHRIRHGTILDYARGDVYTYNNGTRAAGGARLHILFHEII